MCHDYENGFELSSDPITDSPSSAGPLWNLMGQKDICIPLTINVAFILILFKSKAEFMASLSTSKYKQGEKTVNKKPNANMRVRSNSSILVKDGSGRDWEKVVIVNSFALNNKKDEQNNRLTGDKSKYIKAMIDCISEIFSGIGSTLRNASRKKRQKARMVYFLKYIYNKKAKYSV
jgi:hypothetical protein